MLKSTSCFTGMKISIAAENLAGAGEEFGGTQDMALFLRRDVEFTKLCGMRYRQNTLTFRRVAGFSHWGK